MIAWTTRVALVTMTCCALALLACKNDGDPAGIDFKQKTRITLDNAWPHEDGNQWTYDVRFSVTGPADPVPTFPTRDDVPAMPTLDEIAAQLPDLSRPGGPLGDANYRLRFNGRGVTDSGAEGQRLESSYEDDEWHFKGVDRFLAWLASYRPDLFTEGMPKTAADREFAPLFISDGIWRHTPDYISFLNDLDQEAHFRLLESDLRVGHEWSMLTVPSLSSDVVLHARVLDRRRNKALPILNGDAGETVRVLYAFDVGVAQLRTPYEPTGDYFRAILYAVVDYEAKVGPTYFREFNQVYLDKDLDGNTIFLDPRAELEGWLNDFD